jgi:small GTP-binding protein
MTKTVNMSVKVCLLGDGAVGKTCLISQFVDDVFNDKYVPTIGTKTTRKSIIIEKPEMDTIFRIDMIIWDIMGQISFRKLLHAAYLRGAKGVLLVCDLTRRETLDHMDEWINSLYSEWKPVPSVFIGNKNDLKGKHEFGKEELESYASTYDSPCLISSAKTYENVEKSFIKLGERIIDESLIDNRYSH